VGVNEDGPRWERMDPVARREQILRCARRLFTERPYAEVSMGEVAEAAGVRRGLVNHYFGSKRALFLAVVRDILSEFDRVFPLATSDGPMDVVVAQHVDQWLKVVEQEADAWLALVAAEGFGRDPDVERLVDRARGAMVEGTITALRLETSPELRVVLRTYSGLAEQATWEWLGQGTLDRGQVEALLASALVSLIRDVVPAVRAARGP
jgi:AcrR family transcriptional regulator